MMEKYEQERYGITYKGYNDFIAKNMEVRKKGNALIFEMIEMKTQFSPEIEGCIVGSSHLYNERDDMQKTVLDAEPAIRKLLKYRTDENPNTWKWVVPILMEGKDGRSRPVSGQESYWGSSTWKGKTAITIMAPSRLIDLVCPEYFTYGVDDPRQHVRCEKEGIDYRVKAMTQCTALETPWLDVDKKMKVGRTDSESIVSTALAAMKMQMPEIPVYLKNDVWTESDRQKLGNGDTSILWNNLEDFRV